jgi:hypothetical protein
MIVLLMLPIIYVVLTIVALFDEFGFIGNT